MYYHASPTAGISVLEPRVSNHGIALIYFSTKRENVLVYLSNAVEKYCRETGFVYDGRWQKWGPYGFGPDGRLRLEEYYPNALRETYEGVSGWIYRAERITPARFDTQIPCAAVSSAPVEVCGAEFVPDALEAILEAERRGLITIRRYEEMSENELAWLRRITPGEYEEAADHPEYRHFLRAKFPEMLGSAADGSSARERSDAAASLAAKPVTDVVAALIWKDGRFMIAQRPEYKARPLLWEYVGGKVEPGETKEEALIRECREELGITVSVGAPFTEVLHVYPDLTIRLTLFHAAIVEGTPTLFEHKALRWILPSEIPDYPFCPADEEINRKIREMV